MILGIIASTNSTNVIKIHMSKFQEMASNAESNICAFLS